MTKIISLSKVYRGGGCLIVWISPPPPAKIPSFPFLFHPFSTFSGVGGGGAKDHICPPIIKKYTPLSKEEGTKKSRQVSWDIWTTTQVPSAALTVPIWFPVGGCFLPSVPINLNQTRRQLISDVDQDWLYLDPDPQNLKNTDPDSDFKTSFKCKKKYNVQVWT